MQTLHKIDVMFKEGGIFHDSSEGLVTQKAIACLKGLGMVTYFDGTREIAVSLPVPKYYKTAMQERAKIIHDVFTSFFKVNFPQHDIVNAFASLDLDLKLDWKSRKRLVFALATHEAMDGEQLWQELTSTSSDDGGDAAPALGLFGRAKWHLTQDCANSAAAWLKTLASLKNQQRPLAARLIRKALVIQTGTASVERWLNQIALTEMKHRANSLHIYNLESAVKLNVQSCFGRRIGCRFDPNSILEGQPQHCKPSRFGVAVADAYREWFGEKSTPARRGVPGHGDRPSLGFLHAAKSERSTTNVLKNHSKAIGLAMSASTSKSSGRTQKERLQDMVNAVDEVAMARNGAPSSSTVGAASSASGSKKARVDSDNGDKCLGGIETEKKESEKEKTQKDKKKKKEKDDKKEKGNKQEKDDKKEKDKKEKDKKEKDKQKDKKKHDDKEKKRNRAEESEEEEGPGMKKSRALAAEVVEHQQNIAEVQLRVAKEAGPGGKPTYVDARGGLSKGLTLKGARSSLAAAPLRSLGVKVFLPSDVPKKTDCSRFKAVSDARAADVVVVKDLAAGLYTPESLVARLYGLRVVGLEWYESKGSKGETVCYAPAFHFHLHLWLSPAFVMRHPEHCLVLKEEVRRLTGFAKAPGHLHIYEGEMPEKPPHPRLSYYCDPAASTPRVLTLEGLLARLSSVRTELRT